MELSDQHQRESALDPARSFIVQAPAGSGKTDLLIKRFLRLLSCVQNPEEILAITFTCKAAFEMRRRIIDSIQRAETLKHSNELHTKKMGELAFCALERDRAYQWHLLENPNRLRIQTIDSFCMSLVRQMPILSHFGKVPAISDHPKKLYAEAVDELIQYIDDDQVIWSKALGGLLLHLDNRLSVLRMLLIDMLSKRDQWLPYVLEKKLRYELEKNLKTITVDCLEKLKESFPQDLYDELLELIQFSSPQNEILSSFLNEHLQVEAQRKQWSALSDLLLTQNNQFRSSVSRSHGFLSVDSTKDPEQKAVYRQMKQRMEALLQVLSKHEDLHEALIELRYLPALTYTDQQWQTLIALLELLPIAVAQLKLIFQRHSQVDFIEVASAALTALGSSEAPTDLALSLDYKIHHVLIDEFQDTSIAHFHLFEQLISEWQQNDGRTLFIVGDPMQSIYRFRNAEVGLFLRAFKEGVGSVPLVPLTLSVNFRSNKQIVDWLNQTFSKIFPVCEDISLGAVRYCLAESCCEQFDSGAVRLQILNKASFNTEAERMVSTIQMLKQQNPNECMAILVKARVHLNMILPVLRAYHVPYQAVEIDRLQERMVIRDLLALTRALLHPADRIAWLSILRAPWCALTLRDLHTIASEKNDQTIWQRLNEWSVLEHLSQTGQIQVKKLKHVIGNAFKERGRKDLRAWILEVWLALEAPAYLENHTDLEDAKAYFDLLDELAVGCTIKSFAELEERASLLFASSGQFETGAVQVMTVHRAKGLEFDTVFLPGLERVSPSKAQQLLSWAERPSRYGDDLILAPIRKRGDRGDTIYRYLCYQESRKDQFERSRLLYVAATRAKKRLYLFGSIDGDLRPPKNSFLSLLCKIN